MGPRPDGEPAERAVQAARREPIGGLAIRVARRPVRQDANPDALLVRERAARRAVRRAAPRVVARIARRAVIPGARWAVIPGARRAVIPAACRTTETLPQ